MIRPPFVARVAAGVALTLIEETRRLPTTAVTFPMTSVSLMLQTTMRLQQTITGLAIKGDQALSFMYPAREQPEWAVFDEDQATTETDAVVTTEGPREAGSIGRFALYSTPLAAAEASSESLDAAGQDTAEAAKPGAAAPKAKQPAGAQSAPPVADDSVVVQLSYDTLTLAQLRPRLRSLSADELAALLDHERAGTARPPYLTMLENRIASMAGK